MRLGRCVDLLDPSNTDLLRDAHRELTQLGKALPNNANTHKFLDYIVFNYLYAKMAREGLLVQSCRAVFVPFREGRLPRIWPTSGIFDGGHVQLCV